jgi:D-arabinose 1-dehydrogenase-like Zn-dependent alcohol dehydrogenase
VQELGNDQTPLTTIQKVCPQYLVKLRFQDLFGSVIGGIAETHEMLDFCGRHNITADVEIIPIQKINEAYERLLKSDVKYRFSIDMASLKSI